MLLEALRILPPALVHFAEDVHLHVQSGFGLGLLHQLCDEVDRGQNHSLTRPCQMWEQAMLNGIVLSGIRGIGGHTELKPEAIGQALSVRLKDYGTKPLQLEEK
jgi:hypothetical protein